MNVDDLVCPFCGDLGLREVSRAMKGATVRQGLIVCASCNGQHDTVAGTPYPGGFEPEDFIAVVAVVIDRGRKKLLPISTVRSMNGAFGDALATRNPEQAFADMERGFDGDVLKANFQTWRHFNAMLGGDALEGANVLAVASGIGLDAVRAIDVGADLTFLEPSPVSLSKRKQMDPELRWVGGLPHRVPFDDETFDLVCYDGAAGAPDIPSLREFFRVLKVGGRLFLTGIGLAARAHGDRQAKRTTFDDFYDGLRAIPVASISALISDVDQPVRLSGAVPLGPDFPDRWIPAWDENIDVLRQNGSFSSFVVFRTAGDAPSLKTISPLSMRPGMVAAWTHDAASGLDRLMAWAPETLTLFEPRYPLATSPRSSDDPVLARWIEPVDLLSPPPGFAVTFEAAAELQLMVNGRLEQTMHFDEDGRGHATLAPRELNGHVLVELRLARAKEPGRTVSTPTIKASPHP